MSRLLLILLLFSVCLTACKKTDTGLAAEKAQAAIDDKIISDYVAQHPGFTRIDTTGVYYSIKLAGTGVDLFTNSTQVTVADTGKFITEKGGVFTETLFTETNDFHPSYILSTVIRGWQLGIPNCKKGGIIRLLIPSRYAYGPNAQPQLGTQLGVINGLPASSVLDFDIQVYDITN